MIPEEQLESFVFVMIFIAVATLVVYLRDKDDKEK